MEALGNPPNNLPKQLKKFLGPNEYLVTILLCSWPYLALEMEMDIKNSHCKDYKGYKATL